MTLEERFSLMHKIISAPQFDLPLDDWLSLYRLVVKHDPALILELGRGWGNSTCVFLECAHRLTSLLVSVGQEPGEPWNNRVPVLKEHFGDYWFEPLTCLEQDILETDYDAIIDGHSRVFLYWDAHGAKVAKHVINEVIPKLPRGSMVAVDDIWPAGGDSPFPHVGTEHQVGPFESIFAEAGWVWDYLKETGKAWTQYPRRVTFAI